MTICSIIRSHFVCTRTYAHTHTHINGEGGAEKAKMNEEHEGAEEQASKDDKERWKENDRVKQLRAILYRMKFASTQLRTIV